MPYLAVAAEIKLLTMAPEKMWTAVDGGDFLTAARLFLFARHIYTGLTLKGPDTPSDQQDGGEAVAAPTAAKIVSEHFPVVSRQWASISHFHEAIVEVRHINEVVYSMCKVKTVVHLAFPGGRTDVGRPHPRGRQCTRRCH